MAGPRPGFTRSTTLELSSIGPRRQGTSPSLSVTFDGVDGPPVGQPIPASFQLRLCTGSVAVDGIVTLEPPAPDGSADSPPLVGTLSIEHDGWSVKGTFHTQAPCTVVTDH